MAEKMAQVIIPLTVSVGAVALLVGVFLIVYYFQLFQTGRIMLMGDRPWSEYGEEELSTHERILMLEQLDETARNQYLRAQAWQNANPPESIDTDISLSQFMSIQEKGVSAWEFEPDLELTNCFVEARTEISFYDSECSVQTNLPIPKQNETYYWEAKMYDLPENSLISVGLATRPFPLFRMPGWDKHSVAYISDGTRRISAPFKARPYAQRYRQGDVVGCGYRPRTGYIFFTLNGKKFEEAYLPSRFNLFPTIGSRGSSSVHVNFGQAGFVFIEANVKKWGLAPISGTLGPPPAYGLERGSILLESATRMGPPGPYTPPNTHTDAIGGLPDRQARSRSDIALTTIRASPPSYASSDSEDEGHETAKSSASQQPLDDPDTPSAPPPAAMRD